MDLQDDEVIIKETTQPAKGGQGCYSSGELKMKKVSSSECYERRKRRRRSWQLVNETKVLVITPAENSERENIRLRRETTLRESLRKIA